ncbi:MAG: FkbM family methyltransferase [Tsuneonella suprasediminis]
MVKTRTSSAPGKQHSAEDAPAAAPVASSTSDRSAAPTALEAYQSARLGLGERATLDDLWYCYRLFLHRPPDEVGFHNRAKLVQKGVTIADLVASFIASKEFNSRVQRKVESKIISRRIDDLDLHAPSAPIAGGAGASAQQYPHKPHLRGMIASLLEQGQFILDIGAGFGDFAVPTARKVGPKGRVVALEPAPELVRLLLANALSHKVANIDVLPFAAADGEGFVSLLRQGAILTSSDIRHEDLVGPAETQIVYARTLDSIVPATQKVDLIRISVDGFDYRALSGAISLLQTHRPPIIGEYAPRLLQQYSGVTGETYLQFLRDCGYSHFVAVPKKSGAIDLGNDIGKLADILSSLGVSSLDFFAE